MLNIIKCSHFSVFHVLLLCLCYFDSYYSNDVKNVNSEQMQITPVSIGLILDMKSSFGGMVNSCIDMAISDFYSAHPSYRTRLQLHKKDAEGVLHVNSAVLELLEHEQVHGILGPLGSTEDTFVAKLGKMAHIPIISFTARSSILSKARNHYFARTTIDDAVQAQALAVICRGFEWTEVVVLYEDTEYGHQFLSHLNKAFQNVHIRLAYLAPISNSTKNNHISEELNILKRKQTKVFLVHMNPSLGFRLFTVAKTLDMMSEGYAWIVTDSLSNFLSSMDEVTRDSMEGVVGIRPYAPPSKGLEIFQKRWKRNSSIRALIMDLNIYGLWAYDSITALAIAVEKIGLVNSSLLYEKTIIDGIFNANLKISSSGPRLIRELSNTKFKGLSGDFQLVDGKLKPLAFEIFNVIGNGERGVGFWSPDRGIIRELTATYSINNSMKNLKNIVWPGDSITLPKGLAMTPTGNLRVAIPCNRRGFTEFANMLFDPTTNHTRATGFAIDIFLASLKVLPFPIDYEFIGYEPTGICSQTKTQPTNFSNWKYDDLLRGMQQEVDMAVADTTIWAPRASYVDFSLPYSESGVVLVVKNKKSLDMWIFTRPLRWDLWLAISVACIFMATVIWILERRVTNYAAPGEESVIQRPRTIYFAPIAVLAFQEGNMVRNNWSFFVLVCWLFMAFILMQSFTANLSAILTVDQLKFAFSEDHYFGYQHGSFMKIFLIENLNVNESRLKSYSSIEEYHHAMSLGSKNGGIDAIFDEFPYMKLFLNRYDPQYKIIGPTYKTNGFGFAFPIGSPLAAYFSKAILNVTQGPEMTSIERKNFGPGYSSQDPLSSTVSQGTSSLTFRDFAGLFCIVGSLAVFAVICSERAILTEMINVVRRFIHNVDNRRQGNNNDDDRDNVQLEENNANAVVDGDDQNDREGESPEIVEGQLTIETDIVQGVGGEIKN